MVAFAIKNLSVFWFDLGQIGIIMHNAWSRIFGQGFTCILAVPTVRPTPQGENAGEAFFIGRKMVIPEQKGIDVFVNKGGSISISQNDPLDGPSFIAIQPSNVNLLIKALREAKKSFETYDEELKDAE